MTKKIIIILALFVLFGGVSQVKAASLKDKLSGRILLQVEGVGQSWYVDPETKTRAFLGRPNDAFQIMREFGLGVSNKDFDSFVPRVPDRLLGKILIKVADFGKAYYVSPTDYKMYYLGRPEDAFKVMRELGLGISNNNLGQIPVHAGYTEHKNLSKMNQVGSCAPMTSTIGEVIEVSDVFTLEKALEEVADSDGNMTSLNRIN